MTSLLVSEFRQWIVSPPVAEPTTPLSAGRTCSVGPWVITLSRCVSTEGRSFTVCRLTSLDHIVFTATLWSKPSNERGHCVLVLKLPVERFSPLGFAFRRFHIAIRSDARSAGFGAWAGWFASGEEACAEIDGSFAGDCVGFKVEVVVGTAGFVAGGFVSEVDA